jgi:hypothetical protein
MKTTIFRVALFGFLVGSISANAETITIDFSVSGQSVDPIYGQVTETGYFTFDSSLIVAGGGEVIAAGMIDELAFTWQGTTYNASTANTGIFVFSDDGALTNFVIGNNCDQDGVCSVGGVNPNSWAMNGFRISYLHSGFFWEGTVTWQIREAPTIEEQLEALSSFVEGIGPGRSSANKVAIAEAYYAVPDVLAACGVMDGFINQARGLLRGRRITGELADQLIADAVSIKAAMGCD